MNYKVCTKCNTNLPATRNNFHVQKRGKYGLRSMCITCSRAYANSRVVLVPKKTEKACSNCKEVFPLTGEYFYKKVTKKGTIIKGKPLSVDSISFRHVCKKCNGLMTMQRKDKKLMIKYGVSTEEELKAIKMNNKLTAGKKNLKYNYPEGSTKKEKAKYIKVFAKGYDLETYQEEWKKRWLEKTKANRKYDYPEEYKNVDKLPKSVVLKMQSEHMNDGFIANRLGFKLEDVPQEILELKRKQLKFYRYVKSKEAKNTNN